MSLTHAFSTKSATRGIRAAGIALAAVAIFALAMQPMHSAAQDAEPYEGVRVWVSGFWEHKVEISWVFFDSAADLYTQWKQGNLPGVQQSLDDHAIWACGWYRREAVGPVSSKSSANLAGTNIYACALP